MGSYHPLLDVLVPHTALLPYPGSLGYCMWIYYSLLYADGTE